MNRFQHAVLGSALLAAACSSGSSGLSDPCKGASCPAVSGAGNGSAGPASGGSTGSGSQGSGSGGAKSDPGAFGNADASAAMQQRDAGAIGKPCSDQEVRNERVIPTVILVIDQSGSMNDQFANNMSRWDVLRDFLLQPQGLIDDLQGQVNFGLAMYSARSDDNNTIMGECPLVTQVAPAANNLAAITTAYRAAEPIDETPTGDAIDKIVSGLDLTNPDHRTPTALVLATDGEPDTCEVPNPQNGQQESIDAVTRAFQLGVRTYIISVGSEVSKQHQQDVANAGVGHKPGDPNAEFWNAGDDKTLRAALVEIVNAQLSCEIELKGTVRAADACKGRVTLNSEELKCNDANGWELSDPKHIVLKGTSCDRLKGTDSVDVHVTFPCDVPIG